MAELAWDYTMPFGDEGYDDLLHKIAHCTLTSAEESSLIEILRSAQELVDELRLTPDKIPLLVDNYPTVALELLVAIDSRPSRTA